MANTEKRKIQHKTWHNHRVKYPAEKNTKKSICDESAANGWRAAAPRPIIPFQPNHDADNSSIIPIIIIIIIVIIIPIIIIIMIPIFIRCPPVPSYHPNLTMMLIMAVIGRMNSRMMIKKETWRSLAVGSLKFTVCL